MSKASFHRAMTIFALAGAGLLLTGCDTARMSKAKKDVAAQLRDPSSAQFRNLTTTPMFVCGEVNGKNGFGAYQGFTRFYATKESATIDPQDTSEPLPGLPSRSAQFEKYWSQFCK